MCTCDENHNKKSFVCTLKWCSWAAFFYFKIFIHIYFVWVIHVKIYIHKKKYRTFVSIKKWIFEARACALLASSVRSVVGKLFSGFILLGLYSLLITTTHRPHWIFISLATSFLTRGAARFVPMAFFKKSLWLLVTSSWFHPSHQTIYMSRHTHNILY